MNVDLSRFYSSKNMQTDEKNEGTITRNIAIMEELARVEYLLTDKTGTLT